MSRKSFNTIAAEHRVLALRVAHLKWNLFWLKTKGFEYMAKIEPRSWRGRFWVDITMTSGEEAYDLMVSRLSAFKKTLKYGGTPLEFLLKNRLLHMTTRGENAFILNSYQGESVGIIRLHEDFPHRSIDRFISDSIETDKSTNKKEVTKGEMIRAMFLVDGYVKGDERFFSYGLSDDKPSFGPELRFALAMGTISQKLMLNTNNIHFVETETVAAAAPKDRSTNIEITGHRRI